MAARPATASCTSSSARRCSVSSPSPVANACTCVVADALEAASRPGTPLPHDRDRQPPRARRLCLAADAHRGRADGLRRTALDALAFEDALRLFGARRRARGRCRPGHVGDRRGAAGPSALRGSGRIDDALRTLDAALRAIPGAGPTARRDPPAAQSAAARPVPRRGDPRRPAARARQHRGSGDRPAELEALLALGRAHYVMSLDLQDFAARARATYQAAFRLARELGDQRAMASALIPTVWFTD